MKNILIAAALMGATFSANATLWVFDDFEVNHGTGPDLSSIGTGYHSGSTTANVSGIMGGQRDAELTVTQAGSDFFDSTIMAGDPDYPYLSWSNGPGALSKVEIIYDGSSSDPKNAMSHYSSVNNVNNQGLGGIDISLHTDFYFDVVYSDLAGSFNYYIQVFDTFGMNQVVTGTNSAGATGMVYLDLDLFDSVDLMNVGAVAFGFMSIAEGADVAIDSFGVVPEPSMLAVFGAGLFGFGFVGSRRKRTN
ncbi:PEP-CTERM sorting domain-containing protein [Photobacterium sanctipauli]|uniref:PEP-CTERM sorting domain-containing protein n=1 Tax=Photobacterium sanctipauli TaxID=1342794 RepID=A0A2T3NY27_9GAMM|nr:PEP-CTERM sorting domain-containing protein [Photobacterium sanctipauli]PSW21194.1 PEP-CTERM sorting domain-containing protein [Photobacterium sanctipauli]